ncbi:MAG: hypothetical protein D6743_09535 [Calditrichaeota bacterium]|nr:MAG: hypothetical protein D6743_09535 [Calditrichota bacterium]
MLFNRLKLMFEFFVMSFRLQAAGPADAGLLEYLNLLAPDITWEEIPVFLAILLRRIARKPE